ncbi:hypothetical protein AXZ77_2118 [Thioclava sp. ES.031]|uniref:PepSY domain-containing protein n=1 Tax=Thioclava sp. ES.031 TaxID=1798203 RepID=UPI000BF2F927|nr:PepSY domain-containing protein [Thioclava sp. ES.031]PFG63511.1 hypothetical protein AXZ77_2118 [Thioclava sp. ES.031]
MRLRRDLAIAALIGALSVPVAPGLARAETASEAVTRQLKSYGYQNIDVHRTLLGRVRITGTRKGVEREIVIDPRSGEILRDLSRSSRRPILSDTPLGGNASGTSTETSTSDRTTTTSDDDSSDHDSSDDASDDSSSASSGDDGGSDDSSDSGSSDSSDSSDSGDSGGSDDGGDSGDD